MQSFHYTRLQLSFPYIRLPPFVASLPLSSTLTSHSKIELFLRCTFAWRIHQLIYLEQCQVHSHTHTCEFWAALEALRLLLGKVKWGQQRMRWEGIKCLQFGWCNWRKAAAFATPFVVGIFLIQKHQTKPSLLPWLGYFVVAVVALINAQCGTWRIRNTAELHLPHAHFACTKSNNSSSMNEHTKA